MYSLPGAPLAEWHDCNYYCRGEVHCDLNFTWYSGPGEGPGFDPRMSRRWYRDYGARYLRSEPAREIRPEANDVPPGHALRDFREATLVFFEYPNA